MDTKTEILNHTERAARTKGYNGFSFDHIARNVGIQKASMYHHFSSKSDLIRALFQRYSAMISGALDAIDIEEDRAGNRLLGYIREVRSLLEGGSSICLSIALGIEHESLEAEILDDLNAFHVMNVDWLEETFKLGQYDGSIANVGDPRAEALACLALIDGAQIMARSHKDAVLFDRATAQFCTRISSTAVN